MITRIGVIFFTIPGVILLTLYGIELSAATDCQQMGLHFDAISKQCVAQQPAFTSFYLRNTYLVNIMLLASSLGAVAMIIGMVQSKQASQNQ